MTFSPKNSVCAGLAIIALTIQPTSVIAGDPTRNWRTCISQASVRFAVPTSWIEAVITAESGGRTHLHGRPITSHKGAMGLMQLMPGTYAEMRRQHGLGPDPYAPCDNIHAGTAYLRAMFDRYGYPGLFAAYNAGPGRYEQTLKGRPLPLETRAYLRQLAHTAPGLASGLSLFVGAHQTDAAMDVPRSDDGLFVPLASNPAAVGEQ